MNQNKPSHHHRRQRARVCPHVATRSRRAHVHVIHRVRVRSLADKGMNSLSLCSRARLLVLSLARSLTVRSHALFTRGPVLQWSNMRNMNGPVRLLSSRSVVEQFVRVV